MSGKSCQDELWKTASFPQVTSAEQTPRCFWLDGECHPKPIIRVWGWVGSTWNASTHLWPWLGGRRCCVVECRTQKHVCVTVRCKSSDYLSLPLP